MQGVRRGWGKTCDAPVASLVGLTNVGEAGLFSTPTLRTRPSRPADELNNSQLRMRESEGQSESERDISRSHYLSFSLSIVLSVSL